jgi:hypothetical protein
MKGTGVMVGQGLSLGLTLILLTPALRFHKKPIFQVKVRELSNRLSHGNHEEATQRGTVSVAPFLSETT